MDAIAQGYSDAFKAANGYAPAIEPNGMRYSVTTRTGTCTNYTARDLSNLTRALNRLAA